MSIKNLVMLVGRLVADPELRYLPNGTPVANFAVAVNRSTRKADGSFEDALDGFFDCELFGGQALAIAEGCSKGAEVHLAGTLQQRKFKAQGGHGRTVSKIEIRVSSIAPLLPTPKEDTATPVAEAAATPA